MTTSNDKLNGEMNMTFKVGDKVKFEPHLSKTAGDTSRFPTLEGVVVETEPECLGDDYPLIVEFDDLGEAFTADGKFSENDDEISLFKINQETQMSEIDNNDYKQILVKSILGSKRYNGHCQSQLAIDAKTDLDLLLSLCDALEKHLQQTEDFFGLTHLQIFTDYSWSIYADDKLLVSSLD